MKNRFFRCQLPLMMDCGLLPVPLMMCCFWGRADLLPWLVAPVAYLLLACICMLIPGKWRLTAAIIGIVSMGVGSFTALMGETIAIRILVPAFYSALLLFTLPMAGWERGREPPVVIPSLGICAHLFAQFFQFIRPTSITAVPPLLMGSFVLFLLLFMLSLNRQSMASAMPDSHTVPVSIRRRNRLLTWIMLVIVLLISLIPVLGQMVERALQWLKQAIIAVVKWLMSLFPSQETSGAAGGAAQDFAGGYGPGETSLLAKILEKIFIVIAAIGIALIALWVLRFLWRKLKVLVRYLYGQLRHYASTAAEDYVDEIEDTREQGEEHFGIAQKLLRRRNAQRGLKDLPPREQIRTRYGLLRGKHPEWASSQTARETLDEIPAQLYEKARYSSHEITHQDSEVFANQPKR